MITLKTMAELFENGLNSVLNNPEIQFKVWAHAGEFLYPRREGNTVITYINGNLITSTSANDANDLVMGVNGLSLELSIPVAQPRTNATQTSEELSKIKDGQYPFVQYILNAVNGYFQTAQSLTLTDTSGKEFSVSFRAGTAVTGAVDMLPILGNCIGVNTYIEVFFIEGGVNSKSVKITVDGNIVPYQALRLGRSPMTEHEVYPDKLISKSVITSTAFAIDVDFPITVGGSSQSFVDYLLDGEPNIAHFVNIKWGANKEETYFMTVNTFQASAQGITNAGGSASLMEVTDNLFSAPQGYQVRKFLFNSSMPPIVNIPTGGQTNLIFALSADCNAFIAGKSIKITAGTNNYVDLTATDFVYDEESDVYGVVLVVDKQVTVVRASAPYIGVYGVTAVSGTWKWNDDLTYIANITGGTHQTVNYTSQGTEYMSVAFPVISRRMAMRYLTTPTGIGTAQNNVCETVPENTTVWTTDGFKTIDFGNAEQTVSERFYNYLSENAKRIITNG